MPCPEVEELLCSWEEQCQQGRRLSAEAIAVNAAQGEVIATVGDCLEHVRAIVADTGSVGYTQSMSGVSAGFQRAMVW